MPPETFFHPFEITEFTERVHAALGRALIVATRFENNVRSLAEIVGVKGNPSILDSDESLDAVITEIENTPLARRIESLFGPFPDLSSVLVSAKYARNHVTNEIAVGLDRMLENGKDELLSDLVLDIYDDVRSIAEGDMVVCTIISNLTPDQIVTGDALAAYSARVADWACNTDELGEKL